MSYNSSPQWKALEPSTQSTYRDIIEKTRDAHGDKRVAMIKAQHIRKPIEEKADMPAAANRLLSLLRILLDRAVETEMIAVNPAASVKRLKKKKSQGSTPGRKGRLCNARPSTDRDQATRCPCALALSRPA